MDHGAERDLTQLEDLAAAWLDAENDVTEGRTVGNSDELARELAERYAEAITAATQEELRLAWEAARARQAEQLIGTGEWMDARRVSELLRTEYLARETP